MAFTQALGQMTELPARRRWLVDAWHRRTKMRRIKMRRILMAILGLYVLLGTAYSLLTPLFEMSDEVSHYPLVRHLAVSGFDLPVQDPARPDVWRQEGNQPPLYYLLAALGTLFIDTSDYRSVYQINPHADVGIIPPDGNINLVVHDPVREALPWYGTVLAAHVARFFSVLLGAGTVLATYLIGREVFPHWPEVALGGAALNAFLPMFLFISSSVNNDNLSNFLAGLLVWQLARLLNAPSAPGYAAYVGLGVTAGAGMLAKVSIGFLLPLVALTLLVISLRRRDWRPLVIGGVVSGGLTLLIAGWWYLRNWQLYGDPTGLNVFLQIVGGRAVPTDAAQLWSERESFLRTWWGLFGGVNVPLPAALYLVFNVLGGMALLGFALYLLARLTGRVPARQRGSGPPLVLIVAWPVVAFAALLHWTGITPASQGRLMFVAIGPISLWLAVGLTWWLRQRWQWVSWSGLAGLYLAVAVLAPWAWIRPAYAPPPLGAPLPGDLPGIEQDFFEPGAEGPALRLRGYQVHPAAVRPGGDIAVTLYWEVRQVPSRRWSLFLHVLDGVNIIVAQRDRYPGRGLLATERLKPGQQWSEAVVVTLPDGVYTPDRLTLALGLYDLTTGERMSLTSEGGDDRLFLEPVIDLLPPETDSGLPNARYDNFNHQMALRGYEVSARRASPGEEFTVTLYWEGLQVMDQDYTVFVHVLDRETETIYGSSDSYPAEWTAPTSTWTPGEGVVDPHTFTIAPETPPGVYQIEVGVYMMPEAGVFERLPIIPPYGGQRTDVVYLSRVAVDGPSPGGETG